MVEINVKSKAISQELAKKLVEIGILKEDFSLDLEEVSLSLSRLSRENEYLLAYLNRIGKRMELKVYHYFKEEERERVRAAEVVEDLQITAPSASRALKRLSKAGFLHDHGGGVYSYIPLHGIFAQPLEVTQDILGKLER